MTILLSILAIAFAAFCVWLAVRIVNRRERWAKWTAAAAIVTLPVAYILGFGVASRATAVPLGGAVNRIPLMEIYWPIGALAANRDSKAAFAISWYLRIWTRPGECVLLPSAGGRYIAVFPHN